MQYNHDKYKCIFISHKSKMTRDAKARNPWKACPVAGHYALKVT